MFVDLLEQPSLTETEVDVCIVGAGAAGITIARELSGRTVSVALLESGGLNLEPDTQALYRGENVGLRYGALDETRFRYFGGSTNPEGWGGWCKPLDEIDFAVRPWVPRSGWPLSRQELDPWYRRAQVVCEAGAFDYDLESWRRRLGDLGDLPIVGDRIETQLAQIGPPTRFGRRYRGELGASENVDVYLHANVTDILTDPDGSTVEMVIARALSGQRLTVRCRLVILAAGGIENARLLLASPGESGRGIGNEQDLVGRFFMDHPFIQLGSIQFTDRRLPDLYDVHFKFRKRSGASPDDPYDPALVAGALALTASAQQSERLLNFKAWLVPAFPGYGTPAEAALIRLYVGLRERHLSTTARRDLMAVLRRPDHAAATAVGRLFRPAWFVQSHRVVSSIEPEPLAESRVMLSETVDPLERPRVRLEWRVGDLVRRTLASAHEMLDEELRRSGLGRLVDGFRLGDEERFLGALGWVWHHMGTTRMHTDPDFGVVDPDCRVHTTTNIYIAGSSVFPTSGNDMPTLTIVALALRLAHHVARRLEAAPADRGNRSALAKVTPPS